MLFYFPFLILFTSIFCTTATLQSVQPTPVKTLDRHKLQQTWKQLIKLIIIKSHKQHETDKAIALIQNLTNEELNQPMYVALLNYSDVHDYTALHLASRFGHTRIVQALLLKNINMEATSMYTHFN